MLTRHLFGLALIAAGSLTGHAASAADRPIAASTVLQRCGEQTCLRISGRRADPAAAVMVEQHPVAVAGRRHWHVSLPLETVQAWSPLAARSIAVTVAGADGGVVRAALPIGVFGRTTDLAALNITTHR